MHIFQCNISIFDSLICVLRAQVNISIFIKEEELFNETVKHNKKHLFLLVYIIHFSLVHVLSD